MLFDSVFFVKGLPDGRRIHGGYFFMADVPSEVLKNLRDALRKTEARHPILRSRLFEESEGVCAFGIRTKGEKAKDALALARHQLDSFIDGLSLVLESVPEVSPLVVVCPEGASDGVLQTFSPTFWIQMQDAKGKAGTDDWAARNDSLFRSLIPFFDVVTGEHPAGDTSLARQLAFSMKMYRHGADTQVFALEFISKFAALEGLVCGGERDGKRRMLTQRLPRLFRKDPTVDVALVDKLWDFRNASVHESQGFHSDYVEGGKPVQIHVDKIDRLFAGVVIFAVEHLPKARSVAELWPYAAGYDLPDFVYARRPASNMRFPGVNMLGGTGVRLTGARALFEDCLRSTR